MDVTRPPATKVKVSPRRSAVTNRPSGRAATADGFAPTSTVVPDASVASSSETSRLSLPAPTIARVRPAPAAAASSMTGRFLSPRLMKARRPIPGSSKGKGPPAGATPSRSTPLSRPSTGPARAGERAVLVGEQQERGVSTFSRDQHVQHGRLGPDGLDGSAEPTA